MFQFQGQETDKEWLGGQAVSYKYRVHDTRIGKFLSVDPLSPEYPWNSPYAFSENDVIASVELEDLERAPVRNINRNSGSTVIRRVNGRSVVRRATHRGVPITRTVTRGLKTSKGSGTGTLSSGSGEPVAPP